MAGDPGALAAVRRIATVLAWAILAVVVFSTLSPIGMRPRLGALVHIERFGAFALLGFLFAVAHPRRIAAVLACVVAVTVGLELLQVLASSRHARLSDLAVKTAGGVFGVGCAWLVLHNRAWLERLSGRLNRNTSTLR